ncbi:hypothetical protein AKN92_07660 [Thiopseudomonas alkaliphila]|nr:hypothetical protein AKN92_07660 [Thiopseudomonas alkaliphila]
MSVKQSPYDYVQQAPYHSVKQAPYLKGLLKPFKGKGDYEVLEQQMIEAREGIAAMMEQISDIWAKPPFSLLALQAGTQPSTSGATHLRWRSRGRGQKMGVGVWAQSMKDRRTPEELLDELYWFEVLRIQTNMQMSCLQFIMKQARECQEKMDEAAEILAKAKEAKAETP